MSKTKSLLFLLFAMPLSTTLGAADATPERVLVRETWYGDNMGFVSNDTPTKMNYYYYDANNTLSRRVQVGLLESGSWLLTNYSRYELNENHQPILSNSLQYGLYDMDRMGFKSANDTVLYEYDAQGRLTKQTEVARHQYSLYEYDAEGRLVKQENWKASASSGYVLDQTLTFSDFVLGGPQSVSATSATSYKQYSGQMTYDAAGNKLSEKHWTVADTPVLNYAEYWTYDETGVLVCYEKKGISGGQEVNATKVEYTQLSDDCISSTTYSYSNGNWIAKGGSTIVRDYAEADGARYSACLEAEKTGESQVSLRWLVNDAVSNDESLGFVLYRNGLEVACLDGSQRAFVEENVPNGQNEYFVRTSTNSSHCNISNVVSCSLSRILPHATLVHASSARKSTEGSYLVTLEWTNPAFTDEMAFVSTNIIKVGTYYGSPMLEEAITDPACHSTEVNFGIDPVIRLYVETYYASGSMSSDTITIDANQYVGRVADDYRRLNVIETWGDAMGEDTGCTKREVFFYGNNNQIQRRAKYGKMLNSQSWIPTEYTTYIYSINGWLEKEYTQAYGRYNYGELGYKAATDTTFYEYDVDGQLIKKNNNLGYTEYTYAADGSLLTEHQVEYANVPMEQTISYSDFAGVDKPRHTESTGTSNAHKWTIDTEYDANGNKVSTRSTKYNSYSDTYKPNELQVFVYDEQSSLIADTVFTIKVSNDVESYVYKSYTTYTPEENNNNRVKVVKRVWDNILKKFGNPATWTVNEYTDINAEKYSPELTVVPVADSINTVALNIKIPAIQQNAMTVFNIYRKGVEIAHAVSYFDEMCYQTDEYGENGHFRYVDAQVVNGEYDYFVEFGTLDASMESLAHTNNISNVVNHTFAASLPVVKGLKEISRRETSTFNSEEKVNEQNIFVTLGWEPLSNAKQCGFLRYNVMLTSAQIAENEEEDGQPTSYELALCGRDSLYVYVQAVYTYGRSNGDTILVTAAGPEEPVIEHHKGILYFNSPAGYQVVSVSENGQWACGIYYDEDTGGGFGFRWNLETGTIENLGDNNYGFQVANDGTVAGSYYSKEFGDGYHTIEVPAIYKEGKWNALELPDPNMGAWGYGISPDGQYVVGGDDNYTSYIWQNGQIAKKLQAIGSTMAYCVSPDGQRVGGWVSPDGTRRCGYWETNDGKFHYLEPDRAGQPWQAGKKFSADGNKLLYWGGYQVDPLNPSLGYGIKAIYDFEAQDTTYIYPVSDDPYNFDLFDMNADASMVIGYEQNMEGTERAVLWIGEEKKTVFAEEYLTALGANFDNLGIMDYGDAHYIARGLSLSGDAKTMAFLYYDDDYGYHSLIVAMDRDITMTRPVNVAATQMTGLSVVKLSWDLPLGDKSTLKGYNVYRNGQLANEQVITETSFYDKDLKNGDYTYEVTAVYEEGESEHTDPVSVRVTTRPIEGISNLSVRQKGYNAVHAIWDAPASNLTPCSYTQGMTDVLGFGGGTVSFESGTLFDAEQMSLYAGHRLTAVSFYPMSQQGSWLVNIYTHDTAGNLVSMGSFKVSQSLKYGEENIFYLPRQITLQAGKDLIVGIQTNVTEESYEVQGVIDGYCVPGHTDLIRQVGEENFYSMNQASQGSYDVAWCVSALLAPEGMTKDMDIVDAYYLYVDGEIVGNTTSNSFDFPALTDGNHELGVETVYATQMASPIVNVNLQVTGNIDALKPIVPVAQKTEEDVQFSWSAPLDDDATVMGYCGEQLGQRHPTTNESVSEFLALTEFTAKELRGYEGYQVNSLSFYPLSDCGFALYLYEENEVVAEIDVEEVTIGQWNTVELSSAVLIQPGTTYHYVVDSYDALPGVTPLATDDRDAYSDYSNLYQIPGESGWYSIAELNVTGNWMMRMNISVPDAAAFDIDTYYIYIDNEEAARQTQCNFSYAEGSSASEQISATGSHTIRVDAHYIIADRVIEGKPLAFEGVSGIEEVLRDSSSVIDAYSLDGIRRSSLVNGINVIRHSDGSMTKQMVK